MTLGEAFLWSLLQLLFEKLHTITSELRDLAPNWDFENEVENLRMMIRGNQAVLNDAEMKQMKDVAVKVWLDDLKHIAYNLEDLLDEIETEALRKKVEEEEGEFNTNQQQQVRTNRNPVRRNAFSFGFEISSKIEPIMVRLEKIAKWRDVLGLREDEVGGSSGGVIIERPPTSSLLPKSPAVLGRDEDKDKIIDLLLLLSSSNEVPSVIPIVGMGGLGKTTLAQLVYGEDDRLKNHFDRKAWVHVSDNFDVLSLTKAILQEVSRPTSLDFEQLNPIQVKLKEELSGKIFLIVLDDVWYQPEYNKVWELLCTPFTYGAPGSTIIVTTRIDRLPSVTGMQIQAPHRLQVLSKEVCWLLFKQQAFANGIPDEYQNLEVIGKKLVDKCQGLPLAVKTLGGLLRSETNDDAYWEYILNSEIWDLPGDDIIPSLRLSYHHLPSHLKRCFAYCAIFPKGHVFVREELVRLWVAEGFVQQKGRKLMEDMAREYFDDLCSRSFFEQSNYRSELSLFVMHDLVNDLAASISGEVCFKFEGNKPCTISDKARHLSYGCSTRQYVDIIERIEAFNKAESLHTFLCILPLGRVNYLPKQFPLDLSSKFSCLRVLCFRSYSIKELPASIRNLKHLRLLDLSYSFIERLPESICNLYNLQTLLLFDCKYLSELPKDLANLINLRHLDTNGCSQLQKIPPGIGRLTSLQTLTNFVVGENSTPRSGIKELHGLSELRGRLRISNLKNVVNVQDATEANLKGKHLSRLELNWSCEQGRHSRNRSCGVKDENCRDEKNDEDVLDKLQPNPSDLKELYVNSYSGSRFPNWIGAPSFKKLASVRLENCSKCRFLPSLGQLPVLKELYIDRNDGVQSIGHELFGDGSSVKQFCLLEKLHFFDMPKWEEWSTIVEEGEEEFPSLCKLTIERCPKLKKFSHCFPSLVELRIVGCKELTSLPKNPSSPENLQLDEHGEEFPQLRKIFISKCPKLKELPHLLPRLMSFEISSCGELTALPRLPSIKRLTVKECDKLSLRRVSDLTSLSYLCIQSLPNLDSLPERSLQHLTELEHLVIIGCPELVVLLNDDVGLQHLASLRRLEISSCPKLLYLPLGLHHLTCLDTLKINDNVKLTSITETGFQRGQRLKKLSIVRCEKLESLPKGLHNLVYLQELRFEGCPALISFPEMEPFLPSLKVLEIVKCENLQSLPEQLLQNKSLEYLRVEGCSSLKSFPSEGLLAGFLTSLKRIEIKDCRYLESLPQGLHNLTDLAYLIIKGCYNVQSIPQGGFPTNLETLWITGNEYLVPFSGWELHRLTSLENFIIEGFPGLLCFPEGLLPSTLTSLYIKKCQNLKSLTKGLHNLTSLKELYIQQCENLESLPEEGLPTITLWICDCPLLTQRCQKEYGEDWSKISHIPYISINCVRIE